MKKLYSLLISALCFCLLLACTRNDNYELLWEEIVFPRHFIYQNQEFNIPVYYEVIDGGFNEVAPNENFSFIQDTVQNMMDYELLELPFQAFNFLSDSIVEIGIGTGTGNIQYVPRSYTSTANLLSLDVGLGQPLVLRRDIGFDRVEACVHAYYYSYFNTYFEERRISSITIDLCTFELAVEGVVPLLETIVESYDLQEGDTIALHESYLQYLPD